MFVLLVISSLSFSATYSQIHREPIFSSNYYFTSSYDKSVGCIGHFGLGGNNKIKALAIAGQTVWSAGNALIFQVIGGLTLAYAKEDHLSMNLLALYTAMGATVGAGTAGEAFFGERENKKEDFLRTIRGALIATIVSYGVGTIAYLMVNQETAPELLSGYYRCVSTAGLVLTPIGATIGFHWHRPIQ